MMVAGHDPRRVADDLLRTLRDAFLCANAGGTRSVRRSCRGSRAAHRARAAHRQRRVGAAGIEVLGQAIVDIRGQAIADPRLVLEVAVVRLARRESRTARRDVARSDRTARERQIGSGTGGPHASATAAPTAPRRAAPAPAPSGPARRSDARRAPTAKAEVATSRRSRRSRHRAAAAAEAVAPSDPTLLWPRDPAVPDLDDVIEAWPRALDALKAPVRATIQEAQPIGIERGAIVFGAPRKPVRSGQRARSEARRPRSRLRSRHGSAREPKYHRASARLRSRRRAAAGRDRHRNERAATDDGSAGRRTRTSTSTSKSSPTPPTRPRPIRPRPPRRGARRASGRRAPAETGSEAEQ